MSLRLCCSIALTVLVMGCSGHTESSETGGASGSSSGGSSTGGTGGNQTGGVGTGGNHTGGAGGACTEGQTRPADDGCNSCSCTANGQWACTLLACLQCPPARDSDQACPAVVVYAKHPETGECCEYGDPCRAPEGWDTYDSAEECRQAGEGSDCTDDSDCADGTVCELGTGCEAPSSCVSGCHDDSDCSPDETCFIPNCLTCPCPGECI